MKISPSPFWSGLFRPTRQENINAPLLMDGELPDFVNGTIYRIGPNPFHDEASYQHWIDGDGMVHAIKIQKGRTAFYSNRWIETEVVRKEKALGRKLRRGLWTPARNPDHDNTSNTNLVSFEGRLLTFWEQGHPYEIDPDTLKTQGVADMFGMNSSLLAHSKSCPWTGRLVTLDYRLSAKTPGFFREYEEDFSQCRETSIDVRSGLVLHDFALSQSHYILLESPLAFSRDRLMSGAFPYEWDPSKGTVLHIIPRVSGAASLRLPIEECFVFHFVRAFETNGTLTVDAVRIRRVDYARPLQGTLKDGRGQLVRWTICLASGETGEQLLSPASVEFPQASRAGQRGEDSVIYACLFADVPQPLFKGILALDTLTSAQAFVAMPEDSFCCEPVLLESPGSESDLLFTLASNEIASESVGLFYEVDDLEKGPIARLSIPFHIPQGFHGLWRPELNHKEEVRDVQ